MIGLALAREMALSGREVVILESADRIGTEASSRTGEVIHAGIHYPHNSLRAGLCVQGRDMLYSYCREKGVDHSRTGELVVATEQEQLQQINKLHDQAMSNGVSDVQLLDRDDVRDLEPGITCKGALFSPSTGIIESHGLMKTFLDDAVRTGALLVLNTPVVSGRLTGSSVELKYGGPEPGRLSCQNVINCAGIHAQKVAASLEGLDPAHIPPAFLCKGSYFTTSKTPPTSRLIFSLPSDTTPGIHLSLDLAGQVRFGPDSQWVDGIDYEVDGSRAGVFAAGVRRYWPDFPEEALQPGFAGYFARTYGPDEAVRDWMIQGPEEHGAPGLVNLFGIDSPGLTACMAIGKTVLAILKG